ncbi:MAG: ESX secretion-associated protein EspG [Labedaea sp.]
MDALTRLLSAERIGGLHRVLSPAAVWRPPDEAEAVTEAARDEIARLGWHDRRQRLDAEVAAALAVLCRGQSEFYGWISHGESTIGVLVALPLDDGPCGTSVDPQDGGSVFCARAVDTAGLASTAGYLSPDMGRSRLRQRVWPVEEVGLVRILDSSAAPPPAADVAGLVIGTWHPDPDSNATATGCLAVVRNARQTD